MATCPVLTHPLGLRCGLTDEEVKLVDCLGDILQCENILAFVQEDKERLDSFDSHYSQIIRDYLESD